jgi:hypothetical protein
VLTRERIPQATNAVEQARAQLEEAANSNDLTALDAAIAHGESVLKTINGAGAARTQSLAEVSMSDVQKWRAEADQAAAKVEKLEGVQARARAAAQMAKIEEKEWLHRAREARSKAAQLAERKETEVDSLQSEKRKLKERLIANEKRIQRVEEEQRMFEQPAPELDVPREPTSTLRQMFREGGRDPRFGSGDGSSGESDRKVQGLEAELQRQIREYREARESVSENAHEAQEHAKEKHLMDEINHIKQARIALIENKKWSHTTTRPAARSSRLSRQEQEKARLLAQESKINKEIANLDGNGDNDHAIVYGHDGRKIDNEVSRALQDQEELPDFVSVGDRGSSKLAKQQAGGYMKHESVLQGFENALGDSKESAKHAMHSTGSATKTEKLQHAHSLPGVNAYSWWSEKSEKVAAKKAQLADIRRRIRSETHRAAKTNCHNLYSCVGSMFSGEEDSPKLAHANKVMLHRKQQELARAQANKGLSVCVCVFVSLCMCVRARSLYAHVCIVCIYVRGQCVL